MTTSFGMRDCEDWKEAISSRADGQTLAFGLTDLEIEAHVRGCPGCASFDAFIPELKRRGMRQAGIQPDLSRIISKSLLVKNSCSRWTILRTILAVCAFEILFFSFQDLFSSSHDARHLGAFSAAIGIAFLMVSLRPTRARMMLPVTGVLGLTLLLGAVFDVVGGQIPLLTEARHLPELLSVFMIWSLAKPSREVRSGTSSASTSWVPRIIPKSTDEKRETA
jgi:predicted anti-sigma-YlaC factor YlaD